MDSTDEPFADGVTAVGEVMEDACQSSEWTRDGKVTNLNRTNFTGADDHQSPPILTPSRSSSSSGEEVIFCGRGNRRCVTSMEKISLALSGLSMGESEKETDESDTDMEGPSVSTDHSSGQGSSQQSNESISVRHLIDFRMHPSRSEALEAERDDPFPGVDLNAGWNRAALRGVKQFLAAKPSTSNNKILSDFAGFSLRAQQLLLPVRADLEELFAFVFKCTGPVGKPFHTCRSLVLSRRTSRPILSTPPTRFQPRSYSLSDFTSRVLGHEVRLVEFRPEAISRLCHLVCDLKPWRGERRRKRKAHLVGSRSASWSEKRLCLRLGGRHVHRRDRQPAPRRGRDGLVLDDAWRVRMRGRAVRAGRWTDGAAASRNGLWAGFHWVLDGDVAQDPLRQKRAPSS